MPAVGHPTSDMFFLRRSPRAQQLRLLQHGLGGFLGEIRRVTVILQNPLDHHLDLGAGAFAQCLW